MSWIEERRIEREEGKKKSGCTQHTMTGACVLDPKIRCGIIMAMHTYLCFMPALQWEYTRGVVTFDSKEPPTQPPQNVDLSYSTPTSPPPFRLELLDPSSPIPPWMLYDTGYCPRMALSYDGQKRINDCRLGENITMKDKWSIINFNACRSTQGRKERGGAISITDKIKCGTNLELMSSINIRSTKLDSSLMAAVLFTQPSLFQKTADVADMRIHQCLNLPR